MSEYYDKINKLIEVDFDDIFNLDNDPRDVILYELAYIQFGSSDEGTHKIRGYVDAVSQIGGYFSFPPGFAHFVFIYMKEIGFVENLPNGCFRLTREGIEFHDRRLEDDRVAVIPILTDNPPKWPKPDARIEMALKQAVFLSFGSRDLQTYLSELGKALTWRDPVYAQTH